MYMTPESAGNRQYDIQDARGTLWRNDNGEVNEQASKASHQGLRNMAMKRIVRLEDGSFGYEAAPTLGEQWDAAGAKGTSEVPIHKMEGADYSQDTLTYTGNIALQDVALVVPDDVSSIRTLEHLQLR